MTRSAIILSLGLHLLLLMLGTWLYSANGHINASENIQLFEVELVQAPAPKQTKQIVETSVNEQPPAEKLPVYEAEKDNFTIKQQIRRGENEKAAAAKQQQQQHETQAKNDPPRQLVLKLDNPLPDAVSEKKMTKEELAEKNIQQALNNQNRSPLSSGVDVSRLGSRDYLPDIPDGEVTLLNAKANKFAVFVRRVASQVFANLKSSGWQSLSVADINNIDRAARFEAILNKQGQLLSVSRITQSGSTKFDGVLENSIRKGAKDPNPPAGAEADDGLIHFTFEAKSWVEIRSNPRTGTPVQRRWLLLGTGLG